MKDRGGKEYYHQDVDYKIAVELHQDLINARMQNGVLYQ